MAKQIYDSMAMKRALTRMTYEIIEKNKGIDDLVLVGIKTRGVYLAQRIADRLKQLENAEVPVGQLDITLYRDDRHDASLAQDPVVNEADLGFDIKDKHVILVDDVLFTAKLIFLGLPISIKASKAALIVLPVNNTSSTKITCLSLISKPKSASFTTGSCASDASCLSSR